MSEILLENVLSQAYRSSQGRGRGGEGRGGEVVRGFIKVLNRRATEFDTRAKNWQGREGFAP